MKRFLNYIFFIFDIIKSNFGKLKSPYKLNFVITKSCNSKCLNCHIWKVKPQNELTLEEISKIAKNVPKLKWIDLTGGEPTNRTDFVDIVRTFNNRCKNLLYVHFPTNGILTEKIYNMTKEISQIGSFKTVVTVSIDGPEEVNDKLRGVPGDFKKAIATFARLKKLKNVDVYIGCTLFNSNYKYIEQFYKEIKQNLPNFKFKDLHFNLGHISEHFYENTNTNDINPSIKIIEEVEKLEKKYKKVALNPFYVIEHIFRKKLKVYLKEKETPMKCLSGQSSLYISEHGTIYPCSMWDKPLYNLRDFNYNLDNITKTKKYYEAINLISQKKCSQCWTPCEAYQTILGNIKNIN